MFSLHSMGPDGSKNRTTDQLSLDITDLTPFTNYTVYLEAETVAVGERSPDITVVTLEDGMTPHTENFILSTYFT